MLKEEKERDTHTHTHTSRLEAIQTKAKGVKEVKKGSIGEKEKISREIICTGEKEKELRRERKGKTVKRA